VGVGVVEVVVHQTHQEIMKLLIESS